MMHQKINKENGFKFRDTRRLLRPERADGHICHTTIITGSAREDLACYISEASVLVQL